MKKLFTTLLIASSIMTCQAKKMHAYLFTYFPGNAPEQEQIHYAISYDGFNFTPLNGGKPIIGSDTIAVSQGVRDPHLLRGADGWFYQVITDMRCTKGWDSNRGMVLMRSHDLIHWQHHTVNFPTRYAGSMFEHVTRVWAPQTIYDKKSKKYIVYFSIKTDDGSCPYDRVYWAYANSDFSDLEGMPKVLFDYGQASIDTDIAQSKDGIFHLFFKTEGAKKKGIRQYTFTDIYNASTWRLLDGTFEQTSEDVEGAGTFPLLTGEWCLMYDCYRNHHYQFCKSADLIHFKFMKNTETKGAFTPRHGTVILINKQEEHKLLKAFPL